MIRFIKQMKVYKIDLFKYLPMKTTDIVGTSPPLIKGGQDLPKIESLGGVPKILIEREDNPEKGGRVDVEMGEGGGCHFFITLQFNCIHCMYGEK